MKKIIILLFIGCVTLSANDIVINDSSFTLGDKTFTPTDCEMRHLRLLKEKKVSEQMVKEYIRKILVSTDPNDCKEANTI